MAMHTHPSTDAHPSSITEVVDAGIGVMDALVDYVTSILRLQGFRLETGAHAALRRLSVYLILMAVTGLGFVLVSCGLIVYLATLIESLGGSLAIVGFLYLVGGTLGIVIVSKKARKVSILKGRAPSRPRSFKVEEGGRP